MGFSYVEGRFCSLSFAKCVVGNHNLILACNRVTVLSENGFRDGVFVVLGDVMYRVLAGML